MNTNIFDDYYNYKIKTIYEYSIFLTKILGIDKNKLWRKKKNMEDSLKWVINDYFKNLFNQYNSNLARFFINDKNLSKYKINNELESSINYFINNEKAFQIKVYEKELVLLACIVHIANNLDIATSPCKQNKNNYKTILTKYLNKFNQIPYINLIDNGKKYTNELLEFIKKQVKKERRFFELLTNPNSFNKYIDISKENYYYIVQYNYSVDTKMVDDDALKYVYDKENINNRFIEISKDLCLVTLMKLFSIRKMGKVFFLPIKGVYLTNENNIKSIIDIQNCRYINRHLKILINYNDYNEKVKKLLDKYHLDYYLYCSKNTKVESTEANNYLFSKDFDLLNNDLKNNLVNSGKKVIVESFDGIVLDNDLIKEMEEL